HQLSADDRSDRVLAIQRLLSNTEATHSGDVQTYLESVQNILNFVDGHPLLEEPERRAFVTILQTQIAPTELPLIFYFAVKYAEERQKEMFLKYRLFARMTS